MHTLRWRVSADALAWFLLVNVAVAAAVGHGLVRGPAASASAAGAAFLHIALLAQVGLVCLILIVPLVVMARLPGGRALVLIVGPLVFTSLHVFLHIDRVVYSMFRFHINGLAYNLLTTPGGFESMRLARGDVTLFVLACIAGLVAEYVLLRRLLARADGRPALARPWLVAALAIVALGVVDRAIYAVADLRGTTSITRLARAIPLYQPTTVKRLASRFTDVDDGPVTAVALPPAASGLAYPRRPLVVEDPPARPNIVWLVLDSWRYDAFTPEVTPVISRLADDAVVFERHVATGNATRFGIFGMFYGLHGSYWHHMLAEQRGPLLISRLAELGYEFKVITPSPLTFPEFRRTVFVDVRDSLVDRLPGKTLLDRHEQTVDAFERYVGDRDSAEPFFAFMFFDSTHAPYDFPADRAPFRPYAEAVNYATMGLGQKRDGIVNRYKNAIHYLDGLTGRVIDSLDTAGVLDETIVLVTGDHGEEFDEHGFWGHNSAFTPEQIHVPLVLRIPGRAPGRVTHATSHQDLAPTFMELLGVRSPASDYSNGQSLFDPDRHSRIVSCGWDECAWVADDGYIVFGTELHRGWGVDVLDRDYRRRADADSVLAERAPDLAALAAELRAFLTP